MKEVLICLIILLMFHPVLAEENLKVLPILNGSSVIEKKINSKGRYIHSITSHRFLRAYPLSLILSEKILSEDKFGGIEGNNGFVSVEAYHWPPKGDMLKKVWAFTDSAATEGSIVEECLQQTDLCFYYYETVVEGCCGGDSTYRYYRLEDGKFLMDYTDILFLEPAKTVIAYYSNMASRYIPEEESTPNFLGKLICMTHERGNLSEAVFSGLENGRLFNMYFNVSSKKNPADTQSSKDKIMSTLELLTKKVSIVMDFHKEGKIIIPIDDNGRCDFVHAIVPPGVMIKR